MTLFIYPNLVVVCSCKQKRKLLGVRLGLRRFLLGELLPHLLLEKEPIDEFGNDRFVFFREL